MSSAVTRALPVALLAALASGQTTIELEYECGDLESCRYLNDGECDDGGPTASYWECPRFSDATDCGTLCDQHDGALPPPPPSCDVEQWAAAAHRNWNYVLCSGEYTAALLVASQNGALLPHAPTTRSGSPPRPCGPTPRTRAPRSRASSRACARPLKQPAHSRITA